MDFDNLHVACGRVYVEDYLNIDWSPRGLKVGLIEGKVTRVNNKYVMKWNIDNGLPVKENSLKILYHSHFLEHLNKTNGIKFLKACYSCLQYNGIMRIAVPDFHLWASNYINNNQDFFDWYATNFCKSNNKLTNLEIFNQMLYSGHFQMYDYKTLEKTLKNIGFKNIKKHDWGNSQHVPQINYLESKESKRKPESLIIECEK